LAARERVVRSGIIVWRPAAVHEARAAEEVGKCGEDGQDGRRHEEKPDHHVEEDQRRGS